MLESQCWLLNAQTIRVALAAYGAAVLLHAVWRSRPDEPQDPIRDSGPIL